MPKRKKQNPKEPKKAMTAYMIFSQEKRADIKKEHPEVTFGETGKLLGESWKKLSEEDRQKYKLQAAKDKVRYQKEMADYKQEHPNSSEDEKPKKKRKKVKKDPNAPKKPCSAFFHFSKKMRATIKEQNPNASFGEIGKLIGAAWRELAADQKKTFEEAAEQDKHRYEKENAAYLAKKESESESSSESESDSDEGSDSSSSSSSESDAK